MFKDIKSKMGTGLVVVLLLLLLRLQAQGQPFSAEIMAFAKRDSLSFPKKGGILFVGSSSIGGWVDMEDRLQDYAIIRRGFGGSTYSDILRYLHEIVLPYRPSKLFLYAGENDLVQGKAVGSIITTLAKIHEVVKKELPYTDLYIISAKPSIKLQSYQAEISELNRRIQAFALAQSSTVSYVDIYNAMLDPDGNLKPGLFISDNLHLNATGYDIWEHVIRQFL
ncbi:hypothetical protein GCM10007415_01500 [Parapedobacter pyrenivorans]|uniref:SGNH hydrolase-type esterase domain-containing protein n=1 Tax=Parapedobacter pyrenivorans TaxID=1305674 RepID=A0A917HCV6_9SPHI|nr:GDSL-type esterase/lipase family protein [Parapedobacter pyrenivorans]GGG73841.1 hypothetical protein GCM10007415_01500 [Parapedobacter pyrenivorans]